MQLNFNTIEEAVSELKAGRMVIVVDDKDRENEGDLVMAAQCATEEAVNFMISKAKGRPSLSRMPSPLVSVHPAWVSRAFARAGS